PAVISIQPMNLVTVPITLIGDSSLISHRWSEKAKKEMLAKQMKIAKPAKEPKNPERDFMESLYQLPDGTGYGFPAVAFKAAAVSGCSFVDGLTKVVTRGAFHIFSELVKIDGNPTMREDMTKIGMGTADLRYRGEFLKWKTTFEVRLNRNVLSL